MIERYIIELLQQEGRAAVPDLGTFFTKQQTAEIDTDNHLVLPPVEVISFADTVIEAQKDDLRDYIFSKGDKLASQIEVELEQYVQSVESKLAEEGELMIQGLGKLEQQEEGIMFDYDNSFTMNYESFGLPKLEARPVAHHSSDIDDAHDQEVDSENKEPSDNSEQTKNAALPWLIIAPLVLLAVAVIYFFFNPQAYEHVKAMISTPEQKIEKPVETNDVQDTSTETEEGTKAPDTATEDSTQGATSSEEQRGNTAKEEAQKATPSTHRIISEPTNRYYLIAGSFNNQESAEQALEEAIKKGYSEAKIVKSDNRFRMSIGDYATRNEATTAAVEAGKKDYKGVWPLKF